MCNASTTAAEPTPVPAQTTSSKPAHPTPLDLINSVDPSLWTRLIDLSSQLPESVHAFNLAHPESKITLLGKCEFNNPGMSHKDRIAKAMLEQAEARGDLQAPDGSKKIILAASSGNTGCSLALIGTLMGYEVNIITNAKCSQEKQQHIQSNGATLWLAESLPAMFPQEIGDEKDYMKQEDLLVAAFPDKYYSVNQYNNLDNEAAHYGSTGAEIAAQTNNTVTHFVMAASTGGTIMGVGRYLKEHIQGVEVVLADPEKSNLAGLVEGWSNQPAGEVMLAEVKAKTLATGGIQVEGAGKGSLTGIMKSEGVLGHVDYAVQVNDFDAFDQCRALASAGVLVGG